MIYPLTEKQKEIADYADSHSYAETQERFGIDRNQVKYLRAKRNRIEREKESDNGGDALRCPDFGPQRPQPDEVHGIRADELEEPIRSGEARRLPSLFGEAPGLGEAHREREEGDGEGKGKDGERKRKGARGGMNALRTPFFFFVSSPQFLLTRIL